MRQIKKAFMTLILMAGLALPVQAAETMTAEVGKPAPNFTATDTSGVTHNLSDFKGKTVVLEWTNHECPFVIKHYSTGNMQTLQQEATEKGAIWLSIVSSAEGMQGHISPEQGNAITAENGAKATAKLLDPSGDIGHLYGAKTTPHMFVIDGQGTLVYAGAIDDNSSPNPATAKTANNYVRAALEALEQDKPIETASTKPYGCSVKYATN